MVIKEELVDELLAQHKPGEDIFGSDGIVAQLTKRLMERMLEAELSDHRGRVARLFASLLPARRCLVGRGG